MSLVSDISIIKVDLPLVKSSEAKCCTVKSNIIKKQIYLPPILVKIVSERPSLAELAGTYDPI